MQIRLTVTEAHRIQRDMRMVINGLYRSVTDVLHPDGSGEQISVLRRQFLSLQQCILIQ